MDNSWKSNYFIGTNLWYAPILGSVGEGGDRERLGRELDRLNELGIKNIRILAGADGLCIENKMRPILHTEPNTYDQDLLDGLDFVMKELSDRNMQAVLYFNNSWEWSGGVMEYLRWVSGAEAPYPHLFGYPEYEKYCSQWCINKTAQQLFKQHVLYLLNRTNPYTEYKYCEDPVIFSIQIGNEPRCFSRDPLYQELFVEWLKDISRTIKQVDHTHLLSIGSEGFHGCENDWNLCRRIHAIEEIDYITCHIWPLNRGWLYTNKHEWENLVIQTLEDHIHLAEELGKPLIIDEFGFVRDLPMWEDTPSFIYTYENIHRDSTESPTTTRDKFYKIIFDRLLESKNNNSCFLGCNFWGWGGEAIPEHKRWQLGDVYTADPAQEDQGLNSVFSTDADTINLIEQYINLLNEKSHE